MTRRDGDAETRRPMGLDGSTARVQCVLAPTPASCLTRLRAFCYKVAERGRPDPGGPREAECVTVGSLIRSLTWPVARAGAGRFRFPRPFRLLTGRRNHAGSRGHRPAPDRAQRGVPAFAR